MMVQASNLARMLLWDYYFNLTADRLLVLSAFQIIVGQISEYFRGIVQMVIQAPKFACVTL